ncbi:MAG: Gfo/Idh/MocA family oxidoreductase, partial [Clostridiales bacterium]|nr:Gfo/Idh/MocA family oxidoreductase [Clostridiales bacterium]
ADEMLAREKLDIVHIITPPDVRLSLMRAVSEAGVPLCTTEKPICIGVRDYKAIRDFAAHTPTRFGVSHQVGWNPNLLRCSQAARAGAIGEVSMLTMTCGMDITNQGTHCLHYGMLLIPEHVRVANVFGSACGWDMGDIRHPAPRTTQATLQFDNGMMGLWASGSNSPRYGDPSTTWQHICVTAYGPKGRIYFREFKDWEIASPDGVQRGDYGGMANFRVLNTVAQAGFHQAMIDWHEGGAAPSTNLARSLEEWRVVLALYQSAYAHEPVDMAGFEPDDDLCDRLFARLKAQERAAS